MPRGSAPGERRGGRKAGVPNNASDARQGRVMATGLAPLDVMIEAMRFLRAQAAAEQAKGEDADRKVIRGYLMDASTIAKDAARYVHPAMSAVTVRDETLDLTKLSDDELNVLDQLRAKASIGRGYQGREDPQED